jgi:selenocysteine lyase/cysteine desulfurase
LEDVAMTLLEPARTRPKSAAASTETLRVVGQDLPVPLLAGGRRPYVFLDNAASTPVLEPVKEVVDRFTGWYASVHRGTGFKSRLATKAYDDARDIVAAFVGADPETHVVIFGKNTTDATNKLSYRMRFARDDVVLCSLSEHHSNDLPYRSRARLVHFASTRRGHLDREDFERRLREHAGKVRLVAITGASNVTGHLPDIHWFARKAHEAGAQILVDAAQLGAHRPIDMKPLDDPEHIDYLTLSAHKMYAPYGTGALIGRRDTFEDGEPEQVGGGVVEFVTLDEVALSGAPERDEAGSPNVIGAVAFAAALKTLKQVGMQAIAEHERELTAYATRRLRELDSLTLYGDTDPADVDKKVGVIPFNVGDLPHALVAAVLSAEHGIGVRNGCFCAHPLILHLLHVSDEQAARVRSDIIAGDRSTIPGLIRASFGVYSTREHVDLLVEALRRIEKGAYARDRYFVDRATGDYLIKDWEPDLGAAFDLDVRSMGIEPRPHHHRHAACGRV